MNWVLPTATGRYVVAVAPDDAGPVLQDWTADEPTPWDPRRRNSFETPVDRLPSEVSALGSRHVRGADLIVDHGDSLVGARLVWDTAGVFVQHGVSVQHGDSGSVLQARALDTTGALGCELIIETSTGHDVVAKRLIITNRGGKQLHLPRAFGPAWELPIGPGARIDYLAGDWSREFTPYTVELSAGEFTIGSRQGITSHTYSPVVAVRPTAGDGAYGIALGWSGSWRLLVDAPPFRDRVRVAGGVDDESTVITLDPGERFEAPTTYGVFAPDGLSGLTRRWHDFQRRVLARSLGPEHRPILYNSWYATEFDVRSDHQLELADVASGLGIELFVVDDGWFAGRTSDHAGLGDWTPDPVKFPAGLDPLISGVVQRGMRFGIWVEPEAVNPDSDLFRDHPDWVYRAGERPLITARNQYVLDFGRPEVITWTKGWLRTLLADGRISYLKWDMNRPVTDGGRPGDDHGRQWSVQHVLGYYAVMRMLRAEFPHVTVETCSGGGGRIDLGVLPLTDVVWPSDETGPRDRDAIQHGFLTAYGPHLMSSWVTDAPDLIDTTPASFEFRFVVAMAGVLGIGADLLSWNEERRRKAAELIVLDKLIRNTVHTGRVVRHGRPGDPVHAIEYGTDRETVILAYGRPDGPAALSLIPATLQPGATYRVRDQIVQAGDRLDLDFELAPDADVVHLKRVH